MGRSRGTLARKGRSCLASHALYATAPVVYFTDYDTEPSAARAAAGPAGGQAQLRLLRWLE